ncbi:MAG TPA: Bax inhibitor-1/YccA family protein [Anaerolineae bacterium]|nr:Bax inhibitor-1/YccA family protein [Anaerolineae bacterium]
MRSLPSDQTVDTTAYEGDIQLVFSQVYLLMTLGLVITAVVAAWISASPTLLRLIYTNWWVPLGLFVVQIILVIVLTAAITRISTGVAVSIFIAYAALLGLTLSAIFIVYTDASIATTFFVTAGTFGVTSIFGFVTKRDLTKMGSLLFMLLIGFVLASLLNLFLHSETIYWILTYLGIAIFVGLIAYDTQKIKRMAASGLATGRQRGSLVVIGALALYLDFINLFLLLLRIFGRSR